MYSVFNLLTAPEYIERQNKILGLKSVLEQEALENESEVIAIGEELERLEHAYIEVVLPKLKGRERLNFLVDCYWYFSIPAERVELLAQLVGIDLLAEIKDGMETRQ